MAKTIDGVIGFVSGTVPATNYIKQINDGTTTHDIAVQSGITFFNGNTEIVWDGKQAVEVVIPTLADIVSNPVVFAGTVGANGTITWAEGKGSNPQTGYLVYIQVPCTFGGQACEAGDMAVYDGSAWRVIQGENQVSLAGTDLSIGANPTNVITVEGQTLALSLNFDDIASAISYAVDKNTAVSISATGGEFTIASKFISLSYEAGSSVDITTPVSISLPYELASDAVTIDSVLQADDINLVGGSFPTAAKNTATSFSATHDLTVSASANDNGAFITSVSAIKSASLDSATAASNDIAYGTALTAISGTDFVTGVHSYDSTKDDGQPVAFTLWGQATVSNSTFVSGLGEANAAGANALVSDVTVGNVGLDATGSGILTGVTTGSDFVTAVSFGTISDDNTKSWFLSGLTEGSEVVYDITAGSVSLSLGNNTAGFTANAVTSASVSNHVLSFTTDSFMKPVDVVYTAPTVSKTGFNKSGVKIENTGVDMSGFTTAALSQPTVTVSYKSILTDNVTLNQASVDWYYDKAKDHNFELSMAYAKLNTEGADVTKANALISGTISTSISADTFVTGLNNDGSFPSLSITGPTGTISGTLSSKALLSNTVSWLAVDSSKATIAGAGTYTLVEVSEGGVAVAAAGNYNVDANSIEIEIPADTFVTDVNVYVNDNDVNV